MEASATLVVRIAVLLLVASIVALPTGTWCGWPLKHGLVFLTAASLCLLWRQVCPTWTQVVVGVVSAVAIGLWSVIGLESGADAHLVQGQGVAVAATLFVPVLLLLVDGAGLVSRAELWGVVFIVFLLNTLLKFVLVVMIAWYLIGFHHMTEGYRGLSGIAPLTLYFGHGIVRIQLPNDLLAPLVLAWCSINNWPLGRMRLLVLAAAWASILGILMTAARYYLSALAFVALWKGPVATVRSWPVLVRLVVCIAMALVLALAVYVVAGRFLFQGNAESDDIRFVQGRVLLAGWLEAPWFGHGLGSHPIGLVRDQTQPWTFEVQWAGLLYQTGALGILLCLGAAVAWIRAAIRCSAHPRATGAAMLWFLASGLFNPALLGSVAGLVLALFLLPPLEKSADSSTLCAHSP